jgi:hypothetical protein
LGAFDEDGSRLIAVFEFRDEEVLEPNKDFGHDIFLIGFYIRE